MESKKIIKIISVILIILGVSVCFCIAVFGSSNVEVRIERAGVCNPLKPVKDKEVPTDEDTKKQLNKYWKKTDKDVVPSDDELTDSLVGDYKLFIGEDEILFNLDLGYVSYNGKYVDISDQFIDYLSEYVRNNDKVLKEKDEADNETEPGNEEECCSCCPDLKPGEVCVDACCPCSDK